MKHTPAAAVSAENRRSERRKKRSRARSPLFRSRPAGDAHLNIMSTMDTPAPKSRAHKAGLVVALVCATLVVAACLVAGGGAAPPAEGRHERHRRHQHDRAQAEAPSPSPSPPPPPPQQYCVYNRADNRIHIGMAAGVACGEISAKQHDVGCGRRATHSPPHECQRMNKNDCARKRWGCPALPCAGCSDARAPPRRRPPSAGIFETYHKQTGLCECLFGSKTSACKLVTAEEAAALDSPPPQACLEGYAASPDSAA